MRKKDSLREKFSEMFELPKDVVLNIPKVTVIGNLQVSVENHLGIIEYTRNYVRINSNIGEIKIEGKDIKIKSVLEDEILIEGVIHFVGLDGEEGG